MMMIYGVFVFELKTVPFQTLSEEVSYRYPTNQRFGERPAVQFAGLGEEKITLSGTLYPEITGGRLSLELFKRQCEFGYGLPLISGNGAVWGFYIVESFKVDREEFFKDGTAKKMSFTFALKKVDPPENISFSNLLKLI